MRLSSVTCVVDRQQIYKVVARYCRGVDRGDVELIRSVHHEDAADNHGMFKGRSVDFARWIVEWERENINARMEFYLGQPGQGRSSLPAITT